MSDLVKSDMPRNTIRARIGSDDAARQGRRSALVMAAAGMVLANRYQLRDRGPGRGPGETWRASDLTVGRSVSVRLLRPEHAAQRERCLAAARRAARVRHPGIVEVHDYGQVAPEGVLFLVTEPMSASSLAAVARSGPLDPAYVVGVLCRVASALEIAHAAGLVHEDIKPANLLLAPGGAVKLADFGLSRAAEVSAARAPATPGGDLYCLGLVAWECLTGSSPFAGAPPEAAVGPENSRLPPLPAAVPPGVAALAADLTAADPQLRPSSAEEVADRCRELMAAPMRAVQPSQADCPGSTPLLDLAPRVPAHPGSLGGPGPGL
jgi:serine/threonine protein kinase